MFKKKNQFVNTISILQLLKFEALCEDGVWGVRKACAECFMAVSWAVTREVRKTRLSPLFVKLLCDQSRWVSLTLVARLCLVDLKKYLLSKK